MAKTSAQKTRRKSAQKPRPAPKIPYAFVLEALEPLQPLTKPMFGCRAIYIGDKIVIILRERDSSPQDNGLWVAMPPEHRESVKRDFPLMRDIELFGPGPTGWQVVPVSDEGFERASLELCELILKGDPRIGKVPKGRRPTRTVRKRARSG